jgi:AraC family transcriptional regulator, regulatory protein of adaptative response / methylated-DNA-[protein]-cysteine methyltransferase
VATEHDPRWARVLARDQEADGAFWYSVSSTRVYCRPSCPARTAQPRFVRLHDTLDDARATGYRPCARCNPEGESLYERNRELVRRACALIADSEHELPLGALAAAVHRSPSHLHRLFREATGLTPKAYYACCRAGRLRAALAREDSVTTALYEAGFGSSAQFYVQAPALLGMQPARYRAGGVDETLHFAVGQCSLGAILVASSARGVAAIQLGDDPAQLLRDLQERFPRARLVGADPDYEALVARVVGLVEAPGTGCDLPLDIRGTAFQQRVWQILRATPPGATISYGEVARVLGSSRRARAVAAACAANPLAVAIPCHRVVREDGGHWGYAWGLERKAALLEREAAARPDSGQA